MRKIIYKSEEERSAHRKAKYDAYRKKIRRFTFQLSLHDAEVRDWFERQPNKGDYLKRLILEDKHRELGLEIGGSKDDVSK